MGTKTHKVYYKTLLTGSIGPQMLFQTDCSYNYINFPSLQCARVGHTLSAM